MMASKINNQKDKCKSEKQKLHWTLSNKKLFIDPTPEQKSLLDIHGKVLNA